MMRRNELSKFAPLSLLAVALFLAPDRAEAGQYPALCTSASKACIYTGPVAPTLGQAVCYNRIDVKLKGLGNCPAGSYPYWLDYGEVVNAVTGLVIAYAPLPDACDLGYCSTVYFEGETSSEPLCCTEGVDDCTPANSACTGDVVWCEQTATNDDGSLSCHDDN